MEALPNVTVDVAIDVIVQELATYLGMRPDVTPADMLEGFDELASSVVGSCHAAITRAERHLFERGDLPAFEKDLRAFARAAGRKWANTRVSTEWPELPTLDTLEINWVTSQAVRQGSKAVDQLEREQWAERLLCCADELTRRFVETVTA